MEGTSQVKIRDGKPPNTESTSTSSDIALISEKNKGFARTCSLTRGGPSRQEDVKVCTKQQKLPKDVMRGIRGSSGCNRRIEDEVGDSDKNKVVVKTALEKNADHCCTAEFYGVESPKEDGVDNVQLQNNSNAIRKSSGALNKSNILISFDDSAATVLEPNHLQAQRKASEPVYRDPPNSDKLSPPPFVTNVHLSLPSLCSSPDQHRKQSFSSSTALNKNSAGSLSPHVENSKSLLCISHASPQLSVPTVENNQSSCKKRKKIGSLRKQAALCDSSIDIDASHQVSLLLGTGHLISNPTDMGCYKEQLPTPHPLSSITVNRTNQDTHVSGCSNSQISGPDNKVFKSPAGTHSGNVSGEHVTFFVDNYQHERPPMDYLQRGEANRKKSYEVVETGKRSDRRISFVNKNHYSPHVTDPREPLLMKNQNNKKTGLGKIQPKSLPSVIEQISSPQSQRCGHRISLLTGVTRSVREFLLSKPTHSSPSLTLTQSACDISKRNLPLKSPKSQNHSNTKPELPTFDTSTGKGSADSITSVPPSLLLDPDEELHVKAGKYLSGNISQNSSFNDNPSLVLERCGPDGGITKSVSGNMSNISERSSLHQKSSENLPVSGFYQHHHPLHLTDNLMSTENMVVSGSNRNLHSGRRKDSLMGLHKMSNSASTSSSSSRKNISTFNRNVSDNGLPSSQLTSRKPSLKLPLHRDSSLPQGLLLHHRPSLVFRHSFSRRTSITPSLRKLQLRFAREVSTNNLYGFR